MIYNNNFPIYCISIPKRKAHCINFFKKLNFKVKYPEIVLKKDIICNDIYKKGIITRNYDCKNYSGKIACTLSHIKVLEYFLKTNYPYCLIFEDDNIIPNDDQVKNIHSVLNEILQIHREWDLINLSPCWSFCTFQEKSKLHPKLYIPLTSVCRNAYAITRKGAENFIKVALPLYDETKGGDYKLRNVPNAFDLHPAIFHQDRINIKTTIGTNNYLTECAESTLQYKFLTFSLVLILFVLYNINNKNILFKIIIYKIVFLIILLVIIQIRAYRYINTNKY